MLNAAFQLLAIALDLGQVIVSELSPLLFDFTRKFVPAAFNAILPISHRDFLPYGPRMRINVSCASLLPHFTLS